MMTSEDFFEKTFHRDFPLVVEEREIFVNRGLLAQLSPTFRKMFFGEFREALPDVTEVPLPNKKLDDILELMRTIFGWPNPKPVTEENAELILELADEYEIASLLQAAIKVIQKQMSNALPGETKIVHWARLCFQFPHCLSPNWPTLFTKISHENLLCLLDLATEKGPDGEELKGKCLEYLDTNLIGPWDRAEVLLPLLVAANKHQLQSRVEALVPRVARFAFVGQIQKVYQWLDPGVIAAVMEAKALRTENLLETKKLIFVHDRVPSVSDVGGRCLKCKFCSLRLESAPEAGCPNRLCTFQCYNFSKDLVRK